MSEYVSTFWAAAGFDHPVECCGCLNGRVLENGDIEVYCNECGEVFIELVKRHDPHGLS